MPSEAHLRNIEVNINSDIRSACNKAIAIRTSGSTHIPHRLIVLIQSVDIAATVQEEPHGLYTRRCIRGDHEQTLSILQDKAQEVDTVLSISFQECSLSVKYRHLTCGVAIGFVVQEELHHILTTTRLDGDYQRRHPIL
jgi:hypothetical protein